MTELLVVDDEAEICSMISRHFRFRDYVVHTAVGGEEGKLFLENNRVDIVISDILMPRFDGIALLRYIKDEYPMVPVIMITGYVTLDNFLSALRLGADTCIFKPFPDFVELQEAVSAAEKRLSVWKEKMTMLSGMKGK